MFGDANQCEPVESGRQIHYLHYLQLLAFENNTKNVPKSLQYIEKSCRYDKVTHKILDTFLKYGKISSWFEPIE